ncbi:MAG TPA: D-alanine--D-alanine ligase [Candidatus Gallacutalibacter stercoravium]|nr:D-alanine--D-alanine ligase [Candidatus Gallacutalibacter stercoravium]
MKIVVLAGGLSPERDVSLSSGSLIANALLDCGHQVLLMDLFLGIDLEKAEKPLFRSEPQAQRYQYDVPAKEPDLQALRAAVSQRGTVGPNVWQVCQEADLVFIALHGAAGENGQVQAALDLMGVRYTGSGYEGSLLAMNKDISKRLLQAAGVKTPAWERILLDDTAGEMDAAGRSFPCVMKPCSCGSSVGVTIVKQPDDLRAAVAYAGRYEKTVLLEEYVKGREFSVGILDGEALPAIEIQPAEGFYNYANKYQQGKTREICPAPITPQQEKRLRELALTAHRTLHLGFYSRVDFLLKEGTQEDFYCLEANTLPGMTPTSLLPQEAAAIGITYAELCEKIALAALR